MRGIHRWPVDSPPQRPVTRKKVPFDDVVIKLVGQRSILWSWWRHQMETFSALLTICAGNSPVSGEFPTQRPVTRSFDVYFDLRPNKRLSKQSWGWWFETPSRPFWRHRNVLKKNNSSRTIIHELNASKWSVLWWPCTHAVLCLFLSARVDIEVWWRMPMGLRNFIVGIRPDNMERQHVV